MVTLHDELEKVLQDSNATPMSLPLEFLKAITRDFSTESELGRGGYGVVYKGVLQSGKNIAVKKLFEIRVEHEMFQNEVSNFMRIKHKNVVQFVGYCAESKWEAIQLPCGKHILAEVPKRLLCFEYVPKKSLDKHIADRSLDLEWNIRYEIIKGICNGLHFLHDECNIIHLDLKPENILIDSNMTPKIADFGLSRICGAQQSKIVTNNRAGTCGYMAPEYINQGLLTKKADIFSLGVIIIEIITGCREYPYFQLDSPHSTTTSCQHFIEKVLTGWRNKLRSRSKYISMEKCNRQVKLCITIALNCVDPGMEKRPTSKNIVQVLSAGDQMEAREELSLEMQCKDKSLVLDTTVSKQLIPHGVNEDMFSNETDDNVGKKLQEGLSRMVPLWELRTCSQNHQEAAKVSIEPKRASNKISKMEDHEELPSDMQYTENLLVLNTTVRKALTPVSVTEDILNNEIDEEVVDETTSECFSPTPLLESSTDSEDEVKESRDPNHITTEVTTSCSKLLDVHPLELNFPVEPNKLITCSLHLTNNKNKPVVFRLMEKRYDWMCFLKLPLYGIVAPRSTYTLVVTTCKKESLPTQREVDLILQTVISDEYIMPFRRGYDWDIYFAKTRIDEKAVHMVALKAIYDRKGKMFCEVEACEELPLDLQCTDKLVINTASKDQATNSVNENMLVDKTDGTVLDEAKYDKGFSPTHLWESSMASTNYLEGGKDSGEPQSAHGTTNETSVNQGSSVILDVYPLVLHFRFQPNKLIPCLLDLTNNTDDNLIFVLMVRSNDQSCFLCLPLYGIISPRSTYTLVVIANKHKNLPEERNIDLILQYSTIGSYSLCCDAKSLCKERFEKAEELGYTVHKVALKAVCDPQGETSFQQPIPPLMKIISVEDTDVIYSLDANQTEPLIVTGSFRYVHMQNYALQKSVGSIETSKSQEVSCVKFIARKRWFVAGSSDGFLHVYNYEKKMEKITTFEAHKLGVRSLSVHPSQPYVLSGSRAQIKLWDWDECWSWKCIRTFEENWGYVCGLAFSPEHTESFASFTDGLNDHTVQVWSLSSPKCKYSLSGHSHNVRCLDFFTRDGQTNLVTGSMDKTSKIWDMQKNKCIGTLPHRSAVLSVVSHPNLPVLVTGTEDGHVYLWCSINFRLKRILNIHGRERVEGLACLAGSRRVAVAHNDALSVMEIGYEEHGGGEGKSEECLSAADWEILLDTNVESMHARKKEKAKKC